MRKIVGPVILALMFSGAAFSQNYTIQTFAGGGVPQGVAAPSASLGSVTGVATDAAGNVYLALQAYSAVVRMDATTQVLTLVAGTGTPGLQRRQRPRGQRSVEQAFGSGVGHGGQSLHCRLR